jgi:hypothetical protein
MTRWYPVLITQTRCVDIFADSEVEAKRLALQVTDPAEYDYRETEVLDEADDEVELEDQEPGQ